MARKAPALADAFSQANPPAATTSGPVPAGDERAAPQPPSRRGRRAVTIYVDPAAHQQLRMLGIELEQSTQKLVTDGINAVFERHGKPPIA